MKNVKQIIWFITGFLVFHLAVPIIPMLMAWSQMFDRQSAYWAGICFSWVVPGIIAALVWKKSKWFAIGVITGLLTFLITLISN
jgi:hypothetical protein